jgi:tetratricopeptide (TPR) repeat protein
LALSSGAKRNSAALLLLLSGSLLPDSRLLIASENLSDHEQFCLGLPEQFDCLQRLQSQLAVHKAGSKTWYKLQSYLLDYYYDKVEFESLRQHIEPLLKRSDIPPVVAAQLYFYYAKTLLKFEQKQEASLYAGRAAAQVEALYKAFGDPLRLVELANLQLIFGQMESATQTLMQAEVLGAKSLNPVFWFELNSNKALVSDRSQSYEASKFYRQRAVEAILSTPHKSKIVIALGNLARTEQLMGQYQLALEHYQQSLDYMSSNSDPKMWAIYHLRLAEITNALHQPELALQYLQQTDQSLLGAQHLIIHQQLSEQLSSH